MNLDDPICLCFHITRRKLVNFTRIHQPKVASLLSECGSAGTGCGWCIPFLKQIHQQGTASEVDVLTTEQYAQQRKVYISEGKGTPPSGTIE